MHNPFWLHPFADPFLLKVRGRYYAYATEPEAHPASGSHVFPILTSTDLITWTAAGKALPALSADHFFYWAPEVTEYNGQFLLYYAVHYREEFSSCIRVAIADQPEGPFVDSGHDLTSTLVDWAIDPHVFRDRDGQWYLYITIEYTDPSQGLVGSGNAVCRMLDPFTLAPELTRVTAPSQPWQLFEAQRAAKGGRDWYTVEAPAVLRHGQQYYELYSGGCYYRDNYAISYATSATPMGTNDLQDSSWRDWSGQNGNPLLVSGTKQLISPGHNSLVLGPNNVDLYTCYHAWTAPDKGRFPCLDRLFWHGDTLWTPAPTAGTLPTPASPRLRELFEQPELSPAWQPQTGGWQIEQGAVVQQDEQTASAILQSRQLLSSNWVLEVNLRHLAGQGAYGIALHGKTGEAARLTLSPDGLLTWSDQGNSSSYPLPAETRLQAWHQLLLTLSGRILTIQFDGLPTHESVVEWTPDTFALITEQSSAAFSGITLTDHFRDVFLNELSTPAQRGWQEAPISHPTWLSDPIAWTIQDGMLTQTNSHSAIHTLAKGDAAISFEMSTAIRSVAPPEQLQDAAIGLLLWHNEADYRLIWLRQAQSGSGQLVVERSGEQPYVLLHNLQTPFDLASSHTLRIECRSHLLRIHLDGPELALLDLPAKAWQVGLTTRNTAAVFQDVWFIANNDGAS